MELVEIKDFEGLYSLDKTTNQVYSHISNRYIKPKLDKDGYYHLGLYKNNKRKFFKLHRLIYQAYYPDIDISDLQIDHIDNNKTNNNIDNLRTCNNSENQWNSKVYKNNLSTGIKNIYLKKNNTYEVQIKKNQKKYTKTFKVLDDAITWKEIKLKELHGEFYNLG